jgi:hypothetical protein
MRIAREVANAEYNNWRIEIGDPTEYAIETVKKLSHFVPNITGRMVVPDAEAALNNVLAIVSQKEADEFNTYLDRCEVTSAGWRRLVKAIERETENELFTLKRIYRHKKRNA